PDVPDHPGARLGAVGYPQLPAVHAVVRCEKQQVPGGDEIGGNGTLGVALADVLDAVGPGGGAVAPPQLVAAAVFAGAPEVNDAAVHDELALGRRRVLGVDGDRVADLDGAGGGAV